MLRNTILAALLVLAAAGFPACGDSLQETGVQPLSCAGKPVWTRVASSPGTARINGTAVLPDGTFIVAGEFTDSLRMLGRRGEPLVRVGRGGTDAFLARINAQGHAEWLEVFGGPGDDHLRSVLVMSDNSIVLSGALSPQAYLLPGDVALRVPDGLDTPSAFLARYSTGGRPLSLMLLAPGKPGRVDHVSQMLDGALVAVGTTFSGLFENVFEHPPWSSETVRAYGEQNPWDAPARYNHDKSNSAVRAATTLNAFQPTLDRSLAILPMRTPWNPIVIERRGPFDASRFVVRASPFIARLSLKSGVEWMKRVEGTGSRTGAFAAPAPTGEAWVAMNLVGSATVPLATGVTRTLTASGKMDTLLVKIDALGHYTFAATLGDAGVITRARGLASTAEGDAMLLSTTDVTEYEPLARMAVSLARAGKFAWTRELARGPALHAHGLQAAIDGTFMVYGATGPDTLARLGDPNVVTLPNGGGLDGFVARLGADGGVLMARMFAGQGNDFATHVTLRWDGAMFVAGTFDGPAHYGFADESTPWLEPEGATDAFMMLLK